MTTVKVIITGFTNADCKEKGDEERTRCTSALIRSDDFVILSDPGVLDTQEIMREALKKENLTVDDITHVFITHNHIDHHRNTGMFPAAKVIEFYGLWDGGKCDDRPKNLTKDIEILETPGHSYDGLTMIVETNEGKIAVAGDLWWSERGPKIDPYASDQAELEKSRHKISDLADFVIPGHGEMFKGSGKSI